MHRNNNFLVVVVYSANIGHRSLHPRTEKIMTLVLVEILVQRLRMRPGNNHQQSVLDSICCFMRWCTVQYGRLSKIQQCMLLSSLGRDHLSTVRMAEVMGEENNKERCSRHRQHPVQDPEQGRAVCQWSNMACQSSQSRSRGGQAEIVHKKLIDPLMDFTFDFE